MASIKKIFFGSWIRTLPTVGVLLVGLYAFAGFVIVPWLARPRIAEKVAELTNRETRLDSLKLNPFTFSGTLTGFEITDTDGDPLLSFSRAHGNVQLFSLLFSSEYHVKVLDLADPFFRFQVNADGSFNVADIINQISEMSAETEEPEANADPKPVRVDVLKVNNGSVSLTDLSLSAPFTSTIAPINFDITGFHTSGESDAPYSFSATSESGESFSWEGFVALEPLRSQGSFSVTGFSMPKYEPFYDMVLQTDLVDGSIGVDGSYDYASGNEGVLRLENTSVSIENMEVVKASDQSPVLSLESGSISGLTVDLLTRALEIQSISFNQGSLHAQRLQNGQIDLINLLHSSVLATESNKSEAPSAPTPEDVPAPSYHIHLVELQGFSVDIKDDAAPKPASFALDEVDLSAKNIRSEPGTPLDLSLAAVIRSGGAVQISGTATLQPVSADLEVELTEFGLAVGNPYLSQFADAQLAKGSLTVKGHSILKLEGEKPTGSFKGDLHLADIEVIGSEPGQDLAKLTRLSLNDIQADLEPTEIHIGTVSLVDPRTSVVVNEDGSINLMQALGISPEETPEENQPAEQTVDQESTPQIDTVDKPTGFVLPFPISIGSITLENAGAVLTDRSISPPVNLGLETLSGTISGLSSEESARADLDLTGALVGGTKLAVTGKINPLIEDRYSDIEMSFKDFNLIAVSPYAGKYAGYALNKGTLSFDLQYNVSQSELSGENVMVIDQLTLGEKVESEDALNLPIPLAISLMKNRNGIIEIDVPVSGNLNDPEFSFGRVISRAIVNVLTKLITSPFSILGSLIPGGKEVDLSMASFIPGAVEFDQATEKKLKLLADALKERPNLTLEIVGAAGGSAEVAELKLQQLNEKLKTIKWREIKEAGNSAVTLDEVSLSQSERDRLVGGSFKEMFPEEVVEAPAEETVSKRRPTPSTESPASEGEESPQPETETQKKGSGLGAFFRRLFGGSKRPKLVEAPTEAEAPSSTAEASSTVESKPVKETESAETVAGPEAKPQLTLQQMEARLLESIEVSDEELKRLANARAEAIRSHLETEGEIAPERLFVTAPEAQAGISPDSGQPRVTFELK